jgi:DNA repair protein RadC
MKSPYLLEEHNLILDNDGKRYILKVRDLAPEEKPREKLLRQGPDALTTPELLAIILNVGTKKEEILTMTSRIMKEYGTRSLMMQRNAETMAKDLDIPLNKAVQIIACAELGRRFFERNSSTTPVIRTAKDAFHYTRDMHELPKEHLRGIYLNTHYKVIHDEVISIGTLDANIIHPREVFKPALEYSAAAVILVHNHPSGVTTPSEADVRITAQLVQAGKLLGIDLIDHIIVTKDAFLSVPINYQ